MLDQAQKLTKGIPTSVLLMLLPALLLSLVFFVIPMVQVALTSILTPESAGQTRKWTLAAYWVVIQDDFYWEVIGRTLHIGILTTLASVVFGYPAALFLYFSRSRWRQVFLFILISPLFVSVIVRAYGWVILLSPNGAINALLPEELKLRIFQTNTAIVVGLVHIYIPFMVLSLNTALSRVKRVWLLAAANLGASPLRIFKDILLPLSLPGLMSGCVIVFSIAMTAFTIPILLGGAKNKTMAYLIYQEQLLLANWQQGSALAVLLLLATLSVVFILGRVGNSRNSDLGIR